MLHVSYISQTKNPAITPFHLQNQGQCSQPSLGFRESLPPRFNSLFISSLTSHVQMDLSLHFLELILIPLCPSQLSFSIFFFPTMLVHADHLLWSLLLWFGRMPINYIPSSPLYNVLVLQSPKLFLLGAPSPFLYFLQTNRGRSTRFSHGRTCGAQEGTRVPRSWSKYTFWLH